MTYAEYVALLQDFNDDGASLTWSDPIPETSGTDAVGDVIRTDPPFTGTEVIPPDSHILIYVSTGTGSGGGFPAVSMFNPFLQGAG
jgi:hypothetical protein